MPQIAVIIPACIQVPDLFEAFRSNLRTFKHDSIARIIVVCNRLTLMSTSALEGYLSSEVLCPVQVIHEKERSVAGAWNRGIEISREAQLDHFLITAVDVSLEDTIEPLLRFHERHPEADLFSSTATGNYEDATEESCDRCDFSCFMLGWRCIEKHGWFDKEYKPAYFEDNDYVTRVVLAGGFPKQVRAARHIHQGSLTIKLDAEMAHHVHHWYGSNGARFSAKWGVRTDDYSRIPVECNASPFRSGRPLAWWPEQDRPGYSTAGGIHE